MNYNTNTRNFLRSAMLLCVMLVFLAMPRTSSAQNWNIKTNLLYDATATINLGLERSFAPKWSVDLSGNLNAWSINDHKWKHWMIQPEARYWFCEAFHTRPQLQCLLSTSYTHGLSSSVYCLLPIHTASAPV